MHRFFLAVLALVCAISMPVAAQEDSDRSRIVRFIEDRLSDGAARQVRIDGFRGALSATAELDRLTIADDDGIWFALEGAELTWSRLALLAGNLQIDRLIADRITLSRLPAAAPGPNLPTAEARPFALPDLPVSVRLDALDVARLEIGEQVLGQSLAAAIEGSARIADGAGEAALLFDRLDRAGDRFQLAAAFDNADRQLALDLLFEEAAGGLVSDLLALPGAPDLRFAVVGEGPLEAFDADIRLATDGQDRVAGTVSSRATPEGAQTVDLDITGDLRPLVSPDLHPFFGAETVLRGTVIQNADVGLRIEDMALRSAALTLSGDIALDASGYPVTVKLDGRIADPDGGQSIRLPSSGDSPVELGAADLTVRFDAARGNGFRAEMVLRGLESPELSIDSSTLALSGTLDPGPGGVSAITTSVDAALTGLRPVDAALATATGSDIRFEGDVTWAEGLPVTLNRLVLSSGDLGLDGDVTVTPAGVATEVALDLSAIAGDLSRFEQISGLPLTGAARVSLQGRMVPLSGAFDLQLEGRGQNLTLVNGLPPALLAGETVLRVDMLRDETGLRLRSLALAAAELDLQGSGSLSSSDGDLSVSATLADIGRFTNALRGPVTTTATLQRRGGQPWQADADIQGPVGLRGRLSGGVGLPNGNVDLQAVGAVPLPLADRFIAPRSFRGTLNFDLAMRGQPGLSALSGQFQTTGARLSLPTLQAAVEAISVSGQINSGRLAVTGGAVLSTGGRIDLDGALGLTQPSLPAQVSVTLSEARLLDPTLYDVRIARADLALDGPLLARPRLSGTVTLGESELRVPETGTGSATAIPDIIHLGETPAERRTRAAAGLLDRTESAGGPGIALDLTVNAPGRIFIRGRGLDAELGGSLQLGGTSAAIIPAGQFDLVRGRLSILGTRLDLTDGSATLQGDFDPFLRLLASSRAGGYQIGISVIGPLSGPEIAFSANPELPEDEVLAQLLFGRSVSALSPVQLLQLADAAASLAGGSTDSGLFARLREGLGLDDLDLQTDEEGNAAVRAGRYLSESVYTDVTVGTEGSADLSLNIDLTPNITARGRFSSDGSTGLGVFFERDY